MSMLGMTLKSGTRQNHNLWHTLARCNPWNPWNPWNLWNQTPWNPWNPLEPMEPIGYDLNSVSTERKYRPVERYWPYVEKPEEPTAQELAALDPDLHATLFGPRDLPFSITLVFPPFEGENYEKALAKARASAEYLEVGEAADRRHRARF